MCKATTVATKDLCVKDKTAAVSEPRSWRNSLLSLHCAKRKGQIKEKKRKVKPLGFSTRNYLSFFIFPAGYKDEPFKHLYTGLVAPLNQQHECLNKKNNVLNLQKDPRLSHSMKFSLNNSQPKILFLTVLLITLSCIQGNVT